MKKTILILTFIIPMLLSAQRMQRHHEFNKEEICFDGLELTDTQKDQIQKIRTEFKKDQIKQEAELKLARLELHELMADEVTGGKLDKAIEKVNNARSDLFSARIKHRVKVCNLLTEEQKDKLQTMGRAIMRHARHECADGKKGRNMKSKGLMPRRHQR